MGDSSRGSSVDSADSGLYTAKAGEVPIWFDELIAPSPEIAWSIVRKLMLVQTFEEAAFMVPYLKDHMFYVVNSVILKKKVGFFRKMVTGNPSTYQPAGKLRNLSTEMTSACLKHIREKIKPDERWYMSDYARTYMKKIGNVKKFMDVKFSGVKKFSAAPYDYHDNIRLSQTMLASMLGKKSPPDFIYLITTSYVARKVRMVLRVGKLANVFLKKNVVIAFDLTRFNVLADGLIQNPQRFFRPFLHKLKLWIPALELEWPDEVCKPAIFNKKSLAVKGEDEEEEESFDAFEGEFEDDVFEPEEKSEYVAKEENKHDDSKQTEQI